MEPINMDLSRTVLLRLDDVEWGSSPGGEVHRQRLEREAAESGHTTSVVRYPPGSSFPAHRHPGGEEILVLDGVFEDDHGHYPEGTYLRNPIGTEHAPRSETGCTLFVKLCQMSPEERLRLVVDTASVPWEPVADQIERRALFADASESVVMLRAMQLTPLLLDDAELLVVAGALALDDGTFPARSWLRLAAGDGRELLLSPGTVLWMKTGHLGG
jgi:quercetin dioxygenase-like cupin family protein